VDTTVETVIERLLGAHFSDHEILDYLRGALALTDEEAVAAIEAVVTRLRSA
jgi:hypothetical protein